MDIPSKNELPQVPDEEPDELLGWLGKRDAGTAYRARIIALPSWTKVLTGFIFGLVLAGLTCWFYVLYGVGETGVSREPAGTPTCEPVSIPGGGGGGPVVVAGPELLTGLTVLSGLDVG